MCGIFDLCPSIDALVVSGARMFAALVCYSGLCIGFAALLFDGKGSVHDRGHEARGDASERVAAPVRLSPQRATKKSSERMVANTRDAPPTPMSFIKKPAPRPPMIRRTESAPDTTSKSSPPDTSKSSTRSALQVWKSESSLRGATKDSASKATRSRSAVKPRASQGGRRDSPTRPFVSSSARFYAEVVRRQVALVHAASEQPAILAKRLPKQENTAFPQAGRSFQ